MCKALLIGNVTEIDDYMNSVSYFYIHNVIL